MVESKDKTNEQVKQKKPHRYRENCDSGVMSKKSEGIKK